MQKLKQLYRSSYAGENIITQLTYRNGEWDPETEMVPNQVFNTYTTTQALAIGNGESRLGFDLTHIANHKGGLFGANRLQTYGCNALYRDFAPDFLVAVGDKIVKEIAESAYTNDNIVYANGQHILEYPGKFYLVPQNVAFDAGALAVYLACFDGHKKIFLLGYDGYDVASPTNNVYKDTNGYPTSEEIQNESFWNLSLGTVMDTYPDVEFVSIMPTTQWYLAAEFDRRPNVRQIDFRDFVLEADIG
jgi:hypothetical protein